MTIALPFLRANEKARSLLRAYQLPRLALYLARSVLRSCDGAGSIGPRKAERRKGRHGAMLPPRCSQVNVLVQCAQRSSFGVGSGASAKPTRTPTLQRR